MPQQDFGQGASKLEALEDEEGADVYPFGEACWVMFALQAFTQLVSAI